MMDFKELQKLASLAASAKKSAPVAYSFNGENFSHAQINEAIYNELHELAYDNDSFRENQYKIFRLIEQTIDEVLPAKVMQQFSMFAETKTIAQGDKAIFRIRVTEAAKRRAKTFVTRVGLAGRYETFKLDGKEMEVKTAAIGSAARIEFEEFLDGRIQFSDLIDLVLEGMDEWIYQEIAKALQSAVNDLPLANRAEVAGFDKETFDNLLAIADCYGHSTIYCAYEFATKIVPETGWISDSMRDEYWRNGYFATYHGHSVIILPQSVTDATNTTKVIDPSWCYIMPAGQDNRPVKIVFEGQTQVRTVENNDDWSRDMQWYKKVGVGTLFNNWMCVYHDVSLGSDSDTFKQTRPDQNIPLP